MGRRSRARAESKALAKPEMIHRTKLFGGRETAEDIHREQVFRRRCDSCGGAPAMRIITMITLVDLLMHMKEFAEFKRAANGGFIPSTPSKYGRLVQLTNVVACKSCGPSAERAAAHPPKPWGDRVIVEIDRGPGADKAVVAVPGLRKIVGAPARERLLKMIGPDGIAQGQLRGADAGTGLLDDLPSGVLVLDDTGDARAVRAALARQPSPTLAEQLVAVDRALEPALEPDLEPVPIDEETRARVDASRSSTLVEGSS